MALETEVILCPACAHLLRVPLDWLGQTVQCPECKAMFKAPVRNGNALTAPELISSPSVVVGSQRKNLDAMLLLPAFGLLFCGVIGVIVNGVFLWKLVVDQDGGHEWAMNQIHALRKSGFGTQGPLETQEQRDEQDAMQLLRYYRWFVPLSLVVSVGVFLGGLSIALRWNYWLGQVGCVLAMVNIAHACCVPGAVAGLWGLLMLNSEEGRGHFRK
jgi:hypothetical protein